MAKRKAETASIDMSDRDYRRVRVIGKDGRTRHSASNDDAVARAMLTFVAGGGDLDKLVKANKLIEKYPGGSAGYKNPGLFRMSLGGTLRALVRNGTPVQIGSVTIKSLDQRVADPNIDAPAKARKQAAAKKAKRSRKAATPAAEAA